MNRARRTVDVRRLPDPSTMPAIIDALEGDDRQANERIERALRTLPALSPVGNGQSASSRGKNGQTDRNP